MGGARQVRFHGQTVRDENFSSIERELHRISYARLFNEGRLAAATDCPTRRTFSSGRCRVIFSNSSGNSLFQTSLAPPSNNSPPQPEVHRPRIRTCFIS